MLYYRSPFRLRISIFTIVSVLGVTAVGVAQTDRWLDLTNSAGQLAAQGRYVEALPIERQALAEAEARYGKQSANYGNSLSSLGFLLMSTGDYTSAESDFTQGMSVIRGALGASSLQLSTPMANLTQLYMLEANAQSANPGKSAPLLQAADISARNLLALGEKNYPADDAALVNPLETLCFVLGSEQKYGEAKPYLLRSLAIEMANLPADHVQIIRTRNELAWVLNATGDKAGAVDQYSKSRASAEKTLGPNDPVTGGIRESLRQLTSTNSTTGSNLQNSQSSNGDANPLITSTRAMLHQITDTCHSGFGALRLQKDQVLDGDTIYHAQQLPGAQKCEVWAYKDKSLGTRYLCILGTYPAKEAAQRDFAGLRQLVIDSFPKWHPGVPTRGDDRFGIENETEECSIELRVISRRSGYIFQLAVDGPR